MDNPNQGFDAQPQGMSTAGKVITGCGIAALVAAVLLAVGVWYVIQNAQAFAAGMARTAAVSAINDSALPAEEKPQIIAHVDRLADQFKAGEISLDELVIVLEELSQSPLLPLGGVYFFEQQHLEPAGLDQEQKARIRRDLDRVARGVYEKKISTDKISDLLQSISTTEPDGSTKIKEHLSDEEILSFGSDAAALADGAEIPDEPYQVDISDEVGAAIDRALARASAAPAKK